MYITKDNTSVFIVNFKTCYSTFEYLKSQDILYVQDDVYDNIFNNIPIYFIARNPINRFISFYKDKIINEIKNKRNFNQDCHKKLLQFYEEDFIRSDQFNIDHVLNAIENCYNEKHILSQTIIFNEVYKIHKNITIINMEDSNFDNKICNLLKIDILPKINNTDSILNIKLNEEQIKRIKKIYAEDFVKFNYNQITGNLSDKNYLNII